MSGSPTRTWPTSLGHLLTSATYSPHALEQVAEDKHFKVGLRTWQGAAVNHTQARELWKTELFIRSNFGKFDKVWLQVSISFLERIAQKLIAEWLDVTSGEQSLLVDGIWQLGQHPTAPDASLGRSSEACSQEDKPRTAL